MYKRQDLKAASQPTGEFLGYYTSPSGSMHGTNIANAVQVAEENDDDDRLEERRRRYHMNQGARKMRGA